MIAKNSLRTASITTAIVLGFAAPAGAAHPDGTWTMTAQTTRGHCGTVEMGLAIDHGRIRSTSGSFAFYPINLGGRVSASGHTNLRAIAGPRIARGTGHFGTVRGSGTWSGRGPSGLCSGVWSASRP
jgi:hypothetical protein